MSLAILLIYLFFNTLSLQEDVVNIYVLDNGVHTEIVVPITNHVTDWRKFIPLEPAHFTHPERFSYLAFGWGDRHFYINTPEWKDLTIPIAINAIVLPSRSVMKVQGYFGIKPGNHVKQLQISSDQYGKLVQFIRNSFMFDQHQNLIHLGQGHGSFDTFFSARGMYFMFYTSNTWTAHALRHTGIILSRGIIFSWDVMDELDYYISIQDVS